MARRKPKPKRNPSGEHLKFDLERMLKLRNIQQPYAFLVRAGITPDAATNFLQKRNGSIKWKQQELLCIALNCQPGDLYTWTAPADDLPEHHELRKLIREEQAELLQKDILAAPPEKLEEIKRILRGE